MPPEISSLAFKTNGEITKGDEHILRMFSSDGMGFALQESDWDVEEEINSLIKMARESDKTGDRLKAIQVLNARIREIAELNGLVVKGKFTMQSRDAQGNRVEAVQSTSRLLTTLRQGRPSNGESPFSGRTQDPIESRDT